MDIKNNLLWFKYKPQTLDDIILLPRVRKMVENGIDNHFLLHGDFGIGKSALIDILTTGKPTLMKNTSVDTSIDVLRDEIDSYVTSMSDIFDSTDDFKYVYLDEFEKASPAFQNALKKYIDDKSDTVRFVFITNHLNKVDEGIKTRCSTINFNPSTTEERNWWKTKCKEKLMTISSKEEIEIEEKDIKKIVVNNYPSLRKMIIVLSEIKKTGVVKSDQTLFKSEIVGELYNCLTTGSTADMQTFIMENYGNDNVQDLMNACGRPLLEHLIVNRKDLIHTDKLGDIYSLVAEHSMWLNTIKGGDPIVVGTSLLHNIKKMIRSES